MEAQLHTFLTFALDEVSSQLNALAALTLGKKACFFWIGGWLGTKFCRYALERNLFHILDSNPGPSSALPSRCTDYVISAPQEVTV